MNNTPSDPETRICWFYAVGREIDGKVELLSYDEYDLGSGDYYSDDLLMCERYTLGEAEEMAKEKDGKVYLVEIIKANDRHITEVNEMYDDEEIALFLCENEQRGEPANH